MRISDWSSDVCSSDLREHDGGMRRGLHGVNGERACGQQALDHVAAVVRIGLGIQWRRQANGLQQSTQNPRIMATTGSRWIHGVGVLRVGGGLHALRSEEHECELQALKRSSSAVL